jgi:hypothetical protein
VQLWRAITSWFRPACAWEEDASISLVVDLDEHRFCGIRVGDPLQSLSFLGSPVEGVCGPAWPNKGLEVGANGQSIREFCFFSRAAARNAKPFPGSFIFHRQPLSLSDHWTEQDLRIFGEPYWRDVDNDETILFFEHGEIEWQVELGADGRLQALVIGEPILADREQRAAYRVTRPWPPQP